MRRAALSAEGGAFLRVWTCWARTSPQDTSQTVEKPLEELSGSPPLELSIVLSSMYGWRGTIVAVAPPFSRAKPERGAHGWELVFPFTCLLRPFLTSGDVSARHNVIRRRIRAAAPPPENSREPNPARTSNRPQRPVRRDNPGGEYPVSGAKLGGMRQGSRPLNRKLSAFAKGKIAGGEIAFPSNSLSNRSIENQSTPQPGCSVFL